jgi:hypothetical protein
MPSSGKRHGALGNEKKPPDSERRLLGGDGLQKVRWVRIK